VTNRLQKLSPNAVDQLNNQLAKSIRLDFLPWRDGVRLAQLSFCLLRNTRHHPIKFFGNSRFSRMVEPFMMGSLSLSGVRLALSFVDHFTLMPE
jgi:hypothetical protein